MGFWHNRRPFRHVFTDSGGSLSFYTLRRTVLLCFVPCAARARGTPSCCASPTSTPIRSSSLTPATCGPRPQRRHGHAPDRASRARGLREVLAGRQVDRLHRPVRRRRAGLCHAGDGRRAAAADLLSRARPASRRAGATTTRSTAGRTTASACSSAACATAGSPATAGCTRCSVDGGPAEPLPMPESGAGVVLARRQPRWSTRRAPAISAPRSATAADRRTSSTSSTSRPTPRRRSAKASAPAAIPCGSATPSYYDSDRDGHFNLYGYDVKGGKTTQLTYEQGLRRPLAEHRPSEPHRLRAERRAARSSTSSRAKARRSRSPCPTTAWRAGPRGSARRTWSSRRRLSPKGERVLFGARGDIFSAPVEKGPSRNLTNTSGAHEKWPRWSPDGSKVAYISDQTGEEELWVVAQDGSSKPGADHHRRQGLPLCARVGARRQADRVQRQGRPALSSSRSPIASSPKSRTPRSAPILDYRWSPRGNHLAFSINDPNGFGVGLHLERVGRQDAPRHRASISIPASPPGIPDGNYLYFLSNHDFAPLISRCRVQLRDQPPGRHLRHGAAQGRQEPVPAGERRGHDRQGRATAKKDDAKKDEKKDESRKTS